MPFLFSTGYDRLRSGYEKTPHLQKPFTIVDLDRQLSKIFD